MYEVLKKSAMCLLSWNINLKPNNELTSATQAKSLKLGILSQIKKSIRTILMLSYKVEWSLVVLNLMGTSEKVHSLSSAERNIVQYSTRMVMQYNIQL